MEATIVLLGPKEELLPSRENEFENIAKVLERNNVMVTVRKQSDFAVKKSDLVQNLNKLLQFEDGQQVNANSLFALQNDTGYVIIECCHQIFGFNVG